MKYTTKLLNFQLTKKKFWFFSVSIMFMVQFPTYNTFLLQMFSFISYSPCCKILPYGASAVLEKWTETGMTNTWLVHSPPGWAGGDISKEALQSLPGGPALLWLAPLRPCLSPGKAGPEPWRQLVRAPTAHRELTHYLESLSGTSFQDSWVLLQPWMLFSS